MRVVSLMCLILAVLATPLQVKAQASMAASAPILMYHRFGEDTIPSTNIRIDQLEAHIALLKSGGYNVVPLDEVVAALHFGTPLPPYTVAITVDDAYRSFVTEGWPRFKAAGLPVTWFLNTADVGTGAPGSPTWDEVRRLRDEGVTFGGHSHAHPALPSLSPAQQEADIDRSLAVFEQELGLRPKTFAYPYGEADAAIMALIERKGFTAAFGEHSGVAWADDNKWWLPRFALNEQYGALDRFRQVIDALPLPTDNVVPVDPTVAKGTPAVFAFTVRDPALPATSVACFGPSGALKVERTGQRVEVRLPALDLGRSRVNCTLPGPRAADGKLRWHWRGTQFVVLPKAR
ncbi:MAG: polysaccharide deacetylase family protein [Rhodospirillaceae bacterium]